MLQDNWWCLELLKADSTKERLSTSCKMPCSLQLLLHLPVLLLYVYIYIIMLQYKSNMLQSVESFGSTQVHSIFPYFHNPIRLITDTSGGDIKPILYMPIKRIGHLIFQAIEWLARNANPIKKEQRKVSALREILPSYTWVVHTDTTSSYLCESGFMAV